MPPKALEASLTGKFLELLYKLIARNTIEEKIQKLQEAKQDLAEQIISGDMGQLSGMSREDILELL